MDSDLPYSCLEGHKDQQGPKNKKKSESWDIGRIVSTTTATRTKEETALFRRKHMPPGNIWKGKKRLYEEVTPTHVQHLRNKFEMEEKNMFYLRHSYITPEQSFGHARALGKNQENYVKTVTKKKEYYENVSIESRLAHVRVNEGWD